ncbi:hypothetical protein [Kitasatospora griseola]|uniref:hypothetical protein n=1 Tax=Kitasatospora griseola TaxID=2064 RepID=UPI00166FFC56|nr:hypothetical protein [Kitasatospora griseola]GGR06099.1 hypothetical protein GCM10010195_71640 [Kitasatospora griseola]
MTAPASGASYLDLLHRAGPDAELRAVLDSAEDGLLAPLHQFLEQAAEVFRQRGDLRSAAALDAHAATVEQVGDELHYLAKDLTAPPRPVSGTTASIRPARAFPAAVAEPVRAAGRPPRPTHSR